MREERGAMQAMEGGRQGWRQDSREVGLLLSFISLVQVRPIPVFCIRVYIPTTTHTPQGKTNGRKLGCIHFA